VVIFVCYSFNALLRVFQKFLIKLNIVSAATCKSITADGRREVVLGQVHYSRRKMLFIAVSFLSPLWLDLIDTCSGEAAFEYKYQDEIG
jgi:hypothetical protein